MVGRSKLEKGSCIDVDRCIKMIEYERKEEDDRIDINILNSRYFNDYRGRTLPTVPRQEPQGD